MTKRKLLMAIQGMPDVFELEDLFKRLLLIERVEEGIFQSDDGETLTEAQARCYLGRWLKQ